MALDHEAVKAIFDSKKPQRIVVVQAENPDGDSLGSAVALDELLTAAGHDVSLFCVVDVPNHLKYIKGWERVSSMPVGYFAEKKKPLSECGIYREVIGRNE